MERINQPVYREIVNYGDNDLFMDEQKLIAGMVLHIRMLNDKGELCEGEFVYKKNFGRVSLRIKTRVGEFYEHVFLSFDNIFGYIVEDVVPERTPAFPDKSWTRKM